MKPENISRLKDILIAVVMTLIFIFIRAFGYSEFISAVITIDILFISDKVYQKVKKHRKL